MSTDADHDNEEKTKMTPTTNNILTLTRLFNRNDSMHISSSLRPFKCKTAHRRMIANDSQLKESIRRKPRAIQNWLKKYRLLWKIICTKTCIVYSRFCFCKTCLYALYANSIETVSFIVFYCERWLVCVFAALDLQFGEFSFKSKVFQRQSKWNFTWHQDFH